MPKSEYTGQIPITPVVARTNPKRVIPYIITALSKIVIVLASAIAMSTMPKTNRILRSKVPTLVVIFLLLYNYSISKLTRAKQLLSREIVRATLVVITYFLGGVTNLNQVVISKRLFLKWRQVCA
jgi:hypothetical protein